MAIKVISKNNFTILDVNRKTQDPVSEVLDLLEGSKDQRPKRLIDFTSLKPNRFKDGDLERLFMELPDQWGTRYFIALPERLVPSATRLAYEYDNSGTEYWKRGYLILNKRTAQAIASQR